MCQGIDSATIPTMAENPALTPWPRRPQRLAVGVFEDLVDRLVSGAWEPGTPLPPEPELTALYGVSRTVVREAMKQLESNHLVRVQQGQGTIVRPLSEWDLISPPILAAMVRHDAELAILEDLVDVRRAVEAQMAARAAEVLTDSDREVIDARLQDLHDLVTDPDAYRVADVAFHDAIHVASGNRLGRAIIHNLTDEAYKSMRYIGDPDADECRRSNTEHDAIRDALVARDATGAAAAMTRHILDSWHRRRPSRADVPQERQP